MNEVVNKPLLKKIKKGRQMGHMKGIGWCGSGIVNLEEKELK